MEIWVRVFGHDAGLCYWVSARTGVFADREGERGWIGCNVELHGVPGSGLFGEDKNCPPF